MEKLRLEKVTYSNFEEILKLHVRKDQEDFVADNEYDFGDIFSRSRPNLY